MTALWFLGSLGAAEALAGESHVLRVSGLVKQPLILDLDVLGKMDQVRVKHNGITRDGEFQGVFWLEGVPLRSLLDLAGVRKEAGGFDDLSDLALTVRDASGRQVALSWGEVMLRNPSEVVLALSARPIQPQKSCGRCHQPGEYGPRMKQLSRRVGLPKLVISGDFYSDRSLEEVTSLEVVCPAPGERRKIGGKLHSPRVTLEGQGLPKAVMKDLPGLPRRQVLAHHVGEGRGFHGRPVFEGVAFRDLLAHWKLKGGLNTVFLVSAPDGYQSLLSYGELFLNPLGERILLADSAGGKPLDDGGRYQMILPDDFQSDRWVKAVERIRAVNLEPKARLTIIGLGCGDSDLISLEALSALYRADLLVAPADLQTRFKPYLTGKPVLFDPMTFGKKGVHKGGKGDGPQARAERRQRQAEAAGIIRRELARGKSVAVLDWGDPMVYASTSWLADYFPHGQIHYVAGLSAFNVGSAALGRNITCRGMVAISDPFTLSREPEMLAALAKKGATLVIFMGLPKLEQVMAAVEKAYGTDTPVSVVLKAGYGQGQQVLEGDLGKVRDLCGRNQEKWLGMIFVGPCLRPGPKK